MQRDAETGKFTNESNTYITDVDGIIHVLKGNRYLFFTDGKQVTECL